MDERLQQFEKKMEKAYAYLEADYQTIRAGRANPHVLDKIRVDYYGTPTPLQQVGNITVPEARMIQIAPWEKSMIKAIEKAILASDVGITPSNDGSVIRLVFPEVTEERRKALVKDVRRRERKPKWRFAISAAMATTSSRNCEGRCFRRRDQELEDKLQKLTDKYTKEIDKLVDTKSRRS